MVDLALMVHRLFPASGLTKLVRLISLICLSLVVLTLASCSDRQDFQGSDITTGKIGQGWELTGHNGKTVSPDTFKGKVTLVFFGFTQCPDICPTALSQVHSALKLLGDQAKDVQVLMVTVDPERDTPAIMREYLKAFNEGLPTEFLGLVGTAQQLQQAAKAFRAYYAKVQSPSGGYTMDHSASFYLLDKTGKTRVLLSSQTTPEVMAHDIKLLLQ